VQYLIYATLIWSVSFSLIGEYMAGIDSYFAVFARIFLAALLFLPFTKFKNVPLKLKLVLMLIGATQIGIMYLFMYHAYHYLSVPEVLLFSVFTPLYVTLAYDALSRKFNPLYLISAAIAVLGAYIIRYRSISEGYILGFILMQCANIVFAFGQCGYKYAMEKFPKYRDKQLEVFGYFHFGAFFITGIAFLCFGNFAHTATTPIQKAVLIWLGFAVSGAGYLLWNKGATKVDSGVLGIMNNALIPAGLIVNILFWNKIGNYATFLSGTAVLVFSMWLHYKIMNRGRAAKNESLNQFEK